MTSIQYITVNPIPKEEIEINSSKPSYYSTSKNTSKDSNNSNNNKINKINKSVNSKLFNNNSGSSSDNEYSCSGHSTSSGSHEFEIQGCRDGRAQVQRVLSKNRRKRFHKTWNNERTREHRKLSNVSSCQSSSSQLQSIYNCNNAASTNKLPSSSKVSQRKLSSSYESLNSDHSKETCDSFSQKRYMPKGILGQRYYSYQHQNYYNFNGNHSNSGRISHNSYDSGFTNHSSNSANTANHNSLSKNFEFCHKYQKESIKKFVQDSHHFTKFSQTNAKYMVDNDKVNIQNSSVNSQIAEEASNNSKSSDTTAENEQMIGNHLWNSLMQIFSLRNSASQKTQTQVYSVKKIENLRSRLESNLNIPNPSYGESQGNELWMADWRS